VIFSYIAIFTLFFSPVLFSGKLLAPGDGIVQSLPAYYSLKTLWTTLIFGGYPVVADPQNMTWYLPAIILRSFNGTWNIFIILGYIFASSFTCWFVRELTGSFVAGIMSGFIYGLSGGLIDRLIFANVIHTACWLPLILLSIEKLRHNLTTGWFICLTISVATAFFAGHAQTFVYCMGIVILYTIVMGFQYGNFPWRYFIIIGSSFFLAFCLVFIQLLPTVELVQYTFRSKLNFDEFTAGSLAPPELFNILFPFIFGGYQQSVYGTYFGFAHGPYEVASYSGILSLILAVIAIKLKSNSQWQIYFWYGIAIFSLIMALGCYTPIAHLVYHVPGYNLVRVPSRHTFEFCFAISILSGLGFVALKNSTKANRCYAVKFGLGVIFVLLLGSVLVLIPFCHLLSERALSKGLEEISLIPWLNPSIGVPVLIAIISGVCLLWWSQFPNQRKTIFLLFVLIIDLSSASSFMLWRYFSPDKNELYISPHLVKYKENLFSSHQRLLTAHGVSAGLDEARPNLSRLMGIPNASGYNPLILERYSQILNMSSLGEINPVFTGTNNNNLDILAVRYLMLHKNDTKHSSDFIKGNIGWSKADLGIFLSSRDDQFQIDFSIPSLFATKVALVTSLSCSANINDHTRVLQALITTADGKTLSFPLMAGQNTSEWAWERSDVKPIVKHKRAQVFESFVAHDDNAATFEGHRYITVLQLGGRYQIEKIKFEWIPQLTEKNAAIALHKISFLDDKTNMSFPVSAISSALSDKNHWQHVEDFGETAVYENLRAMPRAWLVPQVISLKPEQILKAIQTSFLPGGGTFNPHQMALVEEPLGFQVSQPDPFAKAMVVKEKQTSIELVTSSVTPSFLVLSDVNYPGWKATIDGQPVHIFQTNYLLRGIVVPAGGHTVRFEFHPKSFYLGAGISILSAIFLIGLGILSWKKKQR
jgi:hypothetical protein